MEIQLGTYGPGFYALDLAPDEASRDQLRFECFSDARPEHPMDGVLLLESSGGPISGPRPSTSQGLIAEQGWRQLGTTRKLTERLSDLQDAARNQLAAAPVLTVLWAVLAPSGSARPLRLPPLRHSGSGRAPERLTCVISMSSNKLSPNTSMSADVTPCCQ